MTIVYNHKHLKPIKRLLRKQEISAEKILWGRLRNKQQRFKFKRQFGIGNFIVDFYCPKLKLAIEVDGATHSTKIEIKNDLVRKKYITRFGIKVIRYTNVEIFYNIDEVVGSIYELSIKRESELKRLVRDTTKPHPNPLLSKEREEKSSAL